MLLQLRGVWMYIMLLVVTFMGLRSQWSVVEVGDLRRQFVVCIYLDIDIK